MYTLIWTYLLTAIVEQKRFAARPDVFESLRYLLLFI